MFKQLHLNLCLEESRFAPHITYSDDDTSFTFNFRPYHLRGGHCLTSHTLKKESPLLVTGVIAPPGKQELWRSIPYASVLQKTQAMFAEAI
jgi:hypothetical protein